MSKIAEHEILIGNSRSVTLKVYKEKRISWRISLGKNGAILRLPIFFSKNDISAKINWAASWIEEQMVSKPQLSSHFDIRCYTDGDKLTIIGNEFTLKFQKSEHIKRLTAKIVDRDICITHPALEKKEFIKSTSRLLSKVAAKISAVYITKRVDDLNDRYFRKEIGRITFKFNTSNWGSCSSKSNLNFSTRLLLAPVDTIDYVIIHELCHLVHMNHSGQFWALVSQIMPEYKVHEDWLKKNSHKCDFRPY